MSAAKFEAKWQRQGFFFFFFFFSRVGKLHERDHATKSHTPQSSRKRMAQPGKHHPVRRQSASPTTWVHERRFAAQPARGRHQGSTMHLQSSLSI
jgi:hypothetical protein